MNNLVENVIASLHEQGITVSEGDIEGALKSNGYHLAGDTIIDIEGKAVVIDESSLISYFTTLSREGESAPAPTKSHIVTPAGAAPVSYAQAGGGIEIDPRLYEEAGQPVPGPVRGIDDTVIFRTGESPEETPRRDDLADAFDVHDYRTSLAERVNMLVREAGHRSPELDDDSLGPLLWVLQMEDGTSTEHPLTRKGKPLTGEQTEHSLVAYVSGASQLVEKINTAYGKHVADFRMFIGALESESVRVTSAGRYVGVPTEEHLAHKIGSLIVDAGEGSDSVPPFQLALASSGRVSAVDIQDYVHSLNGVLRAIGSETVVYGLKSGESDIRVGHIHNGSVNIYDTFTEKVLAFREGKPYRILTEMVSNTSYGVFSQEAVRSFLARRGVRSLLYDEGENRFTIHDGLSRDNQASMLAHAVREDLLQAETSEIYASLSRDLNGEFSEEEVQEWYVGRKVHGMRRDGEEINVFGRGEDLRYTQQFSLMATILRTDARIARQNDVLSYVVHNLGDEFYDNGETREEVGNFLDTILTSAPRYNAETGEIIYYYANTGTVASTETAHELVAFVRGELRQKRYQETLAAVSSAVGIDTDEVASLLGWTERMRVQYKDGTITFYEEGSWRAQSVSSLAAEIIARKGVIENLDDVLAGVGEERAFSDPGMPVTTSMIMDAVPGSVPPPAPNNYAVGRTAVEMLVALANQTAIAISGLGLLFTAPVFTVEEAMGYIHAKDVTLRQDGPDRFVVEKGSREVRTIPEENALCYLMEQRFQSAHPDDEVLFIPAGFDNPYRAVASAYISQRHASVQPADVTTAVESRFTYVPAVGSFFDPSESALVGREAMFSFLENHLRSTTRETMGAVTGVLTGDTDDTVQKGQTSVRDTVGYKSALNALQLARTEGEKNKAFSDLLTILEARFGAPLPGDARFSSPRQIDDLATAVDHACASYDSGEQRQAFLAGHVNEYAGRVEEAMKERARYEKKAFVSVIAGAALAFLGGIFSSDYLAEKGTSYNPPPVATTPAEGEAPAGDTSNPAKDLYNTLVSVLENSNETARRRALGGLLKEACDVDGLPEQFMGMTMLRFRGVGSLHDAYKQGFGQIQRNAGFTGEAAGRRLERYAGRFATDVMALRGETEPDIDLRGQPVIANIPCK